MPNFMKVCNPNSGIQIFLAFYKIYHILYASSGVAVLFEIVGNLLLKLSFMCGIYEECFFVSILPRNTCQGAKQISLKGYFRKMFEVLDNTFIIVHVGSA